MFFMRRNILSTNSKLWYVFLMLFSRYGYGLFNIGTVFRYLGLQSGHNKFSTSTKIYKKKNIDHSISLKTNI